jgi:alanine racemase
MDLLAIDLSAAPAAEIGSEVLLWGRNCRSSAWRRRPGPSDWSAA